MIKKMILGAIIALAAQTCFAGLTLSSVGAPHKINVFCKDGTNPAAQYKEGPMAIPATGSLPPLPWQLISSILMFDSNNLICKFVLNNSTPEVVVGKATLLIKPDQSEGKIQNVTINPAYTVIIDHQGAFAPDISVQLQKK